jgi:hypothetical protein
MQKLNLSFIQLNSQVDAGLPQIDVTGEMGSSPYLIKRLVLSLMKVTEQSLPLDSQI